MVPLRASILPVPSEPFLKLRLAPPLLARSFRTCLPVPNLLCLARALHSQSVRPACLRFRLRTCALQFPLRLRRGLDWLFELSACACCSCLPGPFESNRRSTAWSSIDRDNRRGQSVYASANTDFSVDKFESRADAHKVVLNQSWRGFALASRLALGRSQSCLTTMLHFSAIPLDPGCFP